jgi:hypothetical protein
MNEDSSGPCICGYTFSTPGAAQPAALGLRGLCLDLAVMTLALTATCLVVWGIARVASEFHQEFLFLLVIVPWAGALASLLRRYCYPNTPIWRAGSLSPLDPIPAPLGRKLYCTLLGTVHIVLGMLLVYVVLSRTWQAARFGAPQTSLVYDVLHPWSVAPLHQAPVAAPKGPGQAGPPTRVAWWLFPGLGALLSFVPLAWCGTLETNTRRNRMMADTHEVPPAELSWARVAAVLALLLFWLPVIGLLTGVVAYGVNRRSRTWTYRASQLGLALTGLVHAALAVLILLATLGG